jgi:hypothetical protein
MGAGRGSGIRFTYYNVADGHLRCGEEIFDWYAGLITGIRTKESVYNNKTTIKLELRMMDHETMDTNNQAIISGTLINNDGTVSTWGRMLLARLVNPDNDLDRAEPLVLSVYPAGETRGSCAALRRLSDPTSLKGIDFHKENPQHCRQITSQALDFLIEKYGTFGKGVSEGGSEDAPWEDEEMAVSAAIAPATPVATPTTPAPTTPAAPPEVPPPGDEDLPPGQEWRGLFGGARKPNRSVGPDEQNWLTPVRNDDDLPF